MINRAISFLSEEKWCLKHFNVEYYITSRKCWLIRTISNYYEYIAPESNNSSNNTSPNNSLSDLDDLLLMAITTSGTGIKVFTLKQTFWRLSVALAQVKAGDTSENLLKMKFVKLCILCIKKKNLLKNYVTF